MKRCKSSDKISDKASNKENDCSIAKKRKNYQHKFNNNWTEQFPWLSKYKNNYAFCNLCDLKLVGSFTHIKRHEQTNKHKSNYRTCKQYPKMETFVKSDKTVLHEKKVYSAELKLIMFLHEHNLPFLLMEHLPKLISSICPDSDIAKSINCGRTKATVITNECLAIEQLRLLKKLLSEEKCYYSIIIDETTDVSIKKCLAVVIRFVYKNKVRDKFLDLIEVQSASAEALFNAITELLTKNEIPLQKIIGFTADNAAVMMGQKSSVRTRFKELNPNIITLSCICHSLHLCSSKATTKLPKSVEEFVRSLYNHFASSPKRKSNLEEYHKFLDLKPYKMLRSSQTRWLSLQAVVDRVLLLWDSFTLYFTNAVFEEDKLHVTDAILNNLNNPVFKIYLIFLSYILDIINKMNLNFQGEDTQIHILHTQFTTLYKNVLRNYIQKGIVDKIDLSQINPTNPDYYLKLEDIYIGANVQLFLNDHSICPEELNKIRINILNFYVELCQQIRKRFDFNDKLLIFLTNFHPKRALNGSVATIAQAAEIFKNLVSNVENLNSEWRQLQDVQYLKKFENASFDQFWMEVFQMKNELNEEMFPNLNQLIKGVMCLPHSSASVERVFSQLNLIKTDLRNRLDIKTCNSIMLAKQFIDDENCYTWEPSETLIKNKAKY